MKFTINLQPTIAIERDPSKSFAAAQITLLAIPLVAFIIIGFFYWHALARQEEIAAKVTSVEAEKTKLNNQRKRGLKAADRKSIEEHRDILRSIFKERTPTTGLLLAKLEETIPNDCYANWMSLERLGEKVDLQAQHAWQSTQSFIYCQLGRRSAKPPQSIPFSKNAFEKEPTLGIRAACNARRRNTRE